MSLTNRIEKLETTADQNQWHGRLDHAAIDAARAAEMDRWTSDELRFFRDLNLKIKAEGDARKVYAQMSPVDLDRAEELFERLVRSEREMGQ